MAENIRIATFNIESIDDKAARISQIEMKNELRHRQL